MQLTAFTVDKGRRDDDDVLLFLVVGYCGRGWWYEEGQRVDEASHQALNNGDEIEWGGLSALGQ